MTALTPDQLDQQYNAHAAIADHPQIFARWREESARARGALRCECNYYYGPSPVETLDIFPPQNSDSPLLVFIHGGCWRSLDKRDFHFLAPAFVDTGVSLAVVNYGLAPQTAVEEIVRQILRALAWLWRNVGALGIDQNRIYVSGHSSGGHLAAMLLAAHWPAYAPDLPEDLVRGGLAVSGLYDLEPLTRAPFLKDDLRLDAAGAAHVSPVTYMPQRSVPLYTAVGGLESAEFKRQNRLIAEAWPHCFVQDVPMPGFHHLNVIEQLGKAKSPLHAAALRMMRVA